jgi:RNA polymerase sigma factor (TIGR02999 family)
LDSTSQHSVTSLLLRWRSGDGEALEALLPLVYGELKRLAGLYLSRERSDHSFETHDLIHEAFLRLVDQQQVDWRNRAHFFAISAHVMRRILVDRARRRHAAKHGGHLRPLRLDEVPDLATCAGAELVALDGALTELEALDPTLSKIVELRFFAGLEHDEVAAVLGVSNPTVRRRWRMARVWLYRRLASQAPGSRRVSA